MSPRLPASLQFTEITSTSRRPNYASRPGGKASFKNTYGRIIPSIRRLSVLALVPYRYEEIVFLRITFLLQLPPRYRYAIEVRNSVILTPHYKDMLMAMVSAGLKPLDGDAASGTSALQIRQCVYGSICGAPSGHTVRDIR